MKFKWLLLLAALCWLPAQAVQIIPVPSLSAAPSVDGDAADWQGSTWHEVKIAPAKEDDNKNFTGDLLVKVAAGHHDGKLYLVARWPDEKADEDYLPWIWRGNKYRKGKDRDDMFAVRFDMAGDFNECMVADADYKVDVWLWSAGRSNPAGHAEDMWHMISTRMQENAAEYQLPGGKTVYIIKRRDAGKAVYKTNKPKSRKKNEGDRLPGVKLVDNPSGSVADVRAKGIWQDGHWTLELARVMTTGHEDDVALKPGEKRRSQIAVFNKANADHKSVSETLEFDFLP